MKNLAIIGSGYAGVTTAVGFAEFGSTVMCVDQDESKIAALQKGELPFYEPDLHKKLRHNLQNQRLAFSTKIEEAVKWADIVFIALEMQQPQGAAADLTALSSMADLIGNALNGYKIIATRSTVPIGTNKMIKQHISNHNRSGCDFDVVSNPDFLQKGRAMADFINPDRVVIGAEHQRPYETMRKIMSPLHEKGVPFIFTDLQTAEMIKYSSNCFLAAKVAFINEMARLCDSYGIDVREVASAMGKDPRIGGKYLNPGPGYGGASLPQDLWTITAAAKERQVEMPLLNAVVLSNQQQKDYVMDKIMRYFGSRELKNRTIAVLGLAFKPETDDLREAPSLDIVNGLLSSGAVIRAYDPKTMDKARLVWKDRILCCKDEKEAMLGADLTLILTEWSVFRNMDLLQVRKVMQGKGFFDARDIYKKQDVIAAGLDYIGIGR
jgi:UDPglucose 6-dehydrogenase